jgi:ABC-type sugar transport system permease subunit
MDQRRRAGGATVAAGGTGAGLRRAARLPRLAPGRALFVAPAILLACVYFGLFFYYPFAKNLYWMFTDFTLLSWLHPVHWVGWANVTTFWHDSVAHQCFLNTFIYAAAGVPLILVVALAVALALHYLTLGKTFLRALVFLTYLMPTIASGIVFRQLLGQYGLFNSYLSDLGLPPVPWLTDTTWAMVGVILFFVWKNMGFFMVILMAGLANLNVELMEAASIDGAGRSRRFLHVTVPQLRPVLLYCLIIATINALNIYPEVVAVTQGDPAGRTRSIMYYMIDEGFGMNSNIGYAALIAFLLFLVVLVITLVQMRVTRFYED